MCIIDTKSNESSLHKLPLELLFLTPTSNQQTGDKNDISTDLSWIFELLFSNINMIAISSILTALLYHTFSTVRSVFEDTCLNGTSALTESQSQSLEESFSNSSELLQWIEPLTLEITPILSKLWNYLLFPIATIALSALLISSNEKVKGWKSGKKDVPEAVAKIEMDGYSLLDSETVSFWVAERPSGFMVQFDESVL